ncbi:hypothetical protein EDEG_03972 [Edhazardia aedis USNM 41457]|uniref:Uncharacterized protein n=1 Tax=Edhazardia aedis (strain USNM 41457) TaxID=1003232 RepID=J9DJ38_EDHAE|nr:hypothetical protein EDEG_03972 [Edhazardia aedis USNM 41457]|eukprot:EJW01402.1 hypothetical protein EDEG_03972 [Edhazardia aedis USNM 41457]
MNKDDSIINTILRKFERLENLQVEKAQLQSKINNNENKALLKQFILKKDLENALKIYKKTMEKDNNKKFYEFIKDQLKSAINDNSLRRLKLLLIILIKVMLYIRIFKNA